MGGGQHLLHLLFVALTKPLPLTLGHAKIAFQCIKHIIPIINTKSENKNKIGLKILALWSCKRLIISKYSILTLGVDCAQTFSKNNFSYFELVYELKFFPFIMNFHGWCCTVLLGYLKDAEAKQPPYSKCSSCNQEVCAIWVNINSYLQRCLNIRWNMF